MTGKKRFGKYVSRIGSRAKRKGGVVATAPATNHPEMPVTVHGLGGSVVGGDEKHAKDEPVRQHTSIGEDFAHELLKQSVADPLVLKHDRLAIDHGLNEVFHYRVPHEIDLHKMAHHISRKHTRHDSHHNHKHVGGGLFEDIGHGIADGLTIGGSIGQILGGTTAGVGTALLATPLGAPLIAAGGAMFSVGTGAKLGGELAGSKIETPGVSLDKFLLGKK